MSAPTPPSTSWRSPISKEGRSAVPPPDDFYIFFVMTWDAEYSVIIPLTQQGRGCNVGGLCLQRSWLSSSLSSGPTSLLRRSLAGLASLVTLIGGGSH